MRTEPLSYLDTFAEASERGSFTAAARALGLTQAAVSQRIHTLERELGVALFHSRFGFTSAWRQLVAVGNGAGLRAHAVLLGTTATLFALVIGTGTGALPVMDQVRLEAQRRKIELVIVPTMRALELLKQEPADTNAILHVTC